MKSIVGDIKKEANSEIKSTLHKTEQKIKNMEEELKNEEKLAKKIVDQEINELESQDEIISDLLNNRRADNTSDMYAESWNRPTFFASPDDKTEEIDILKQRKNEQILKGSSVISTVSNEVDMSAVLTLEKTFGEAFQKKYDIRLGFTPFFVLGSIEALKRYGVFNAHIHDNEIIYKNTFDISIITCGNDGVMAPVIRHADCMTVEEIERHMINLSRRAVEGTLSVEEVSGGTFTVVNAGVYGSLIGTDLLTPPQVATLSVHRMHNRPVATDNGVVEVRPMLYVSLSYDHRVADTALASEFLKVVKGYVENPGYSLLGL
ncbi:MAG: 2-oxo acid dehydrogenase subunit E2 [Alphaproteobacteria bacterium]|nr:2-oxo acid dehydrogenase subunit E2 [Alphaproteobacteria bacterium]